MQPESGQPHLMVVCLVVAIVLCTTRADGYAASFDCTHASTRVERLLCDNPDLSAADEVMASLVAKIRQTNAPYIEANQGQWLKSRNACADANCLRSALPGRIRFLQTVVDRIEQEARMSSPALPTPSAAPPVPTGQERLKTADPSTMPPVAQAPVAPKPPEPANAATTHGTAQAPASAAPSGSPTAAIAPPPGAARSHVWLWIAAALIGVFILYTVGRRASHPARLVGWAVRRVVGLAGAWLVWVSLSHRMTDVDDGIRALLGVLLAVAVSPYGARLWRRMRRASRAQPGRTRPRRFMWWSAILATLWSLAVLWLVTQSITDLSQLSEIMAASGRQQPLSSAQRANPFFAQQYAQQAEALLAQRPVLVARLLFNLWALVGAAGVALLRVNPFHWLRGRRLYWGLLALPLLLGRPLVGWLSPLVGALSEWLTTLPALPEWVLSFLTPVLLVVLTPMCLLVGGTVVIAFVGGIGMASLAFFVGVPVALFNQLLQFDNALHVLRYQRAGLLNYIARFGYWLMGETPPMTPDDTKGARFALPHEVTALHDPRGAAFGHVNGGPLLLHTDKHVLLMASTRSGKGVALIIPHLLRYHGSAFVLDPKGENARATGRQRAALNDTVHYLDPFGLSGKPPSRFNPLSRFTPDNMEAESKALAAALVLGEGGQRDHWTASGQQLLAALIMYVYASPDILPEEKDLPTVRRLLLRSTDAVLGRMKDSPIADGLLADLALSFLDTPINEFGNIRSTAQRETEILDNPFLIASLSASGAGEEVDFADWRTGTMTVYLCLSAPKFPVFSRWLRLVLTAALDEMTDTLNPPPLPVCFMLDELATLGHLGAVENAVGLAAGYGIQLVTVFQDVAQMRDLYKGRWASFIGNAGVRALFNLDDYDTADYWSKFIGGHLVETQSLQQDIYGLTRGQTSGETFRPLLTPEDIMLQFAANTMIVLPQGSHPVMTERVAYFNDPALAGLWDDPRLAYQAATP